MGWQQVRFQNIKVHQRTEIEAYRITEEKEEINTWQNSHHWHVANWNLVN